MKITEDYVSFEVAKLLVQKGLMYSDAEYESYYTLKGEVVYFKDRPTEINIAPRFTIQMACKWLREVHKVHISIYPFNRELPVTDEFYYTCDIATSELSSKEGHLRGIWKTYEEAVEAALKYALENLI